MTGRRAAIGGLCDACRHQRVVRNTRGSVFSLCELAKVDRRFPKYPRLPVLRCLGFEAAVQGQKSGTEGEPGG